MTTSVKISVSLPAGRVEFVDRYTTQNQSRTRSSTIAEAVALLEEREMESAYAAAYDEWKDSEDQALWDTTSNDGLAPEDVDHLPTAHRQSA